MFLVAQEARSERILPWSWIIPLTTKRNQIENVFGTPISKDASNPYQTYATDFGKINILFSTKKEKVKGVDTTVDAAVVVNFFVSPSNRLEVSEIPYDLSGFVRDATYSPREISYFSEERGILLATEIIENKAGKKIERLRSFEQRPPAGTPSPDVARNLEEGWYGVKPLRTRKTEVDKVFGKPDVDDNNYFRYSTKDASIQVNYSTTPCKENRYERGVFSVPENTVLDYTVYFKEQPAFPLLSSLKFDKKKYTKDTTAHLGRYVGYWNTEDGVQISAYLLGNVERVQSIRFQPGPSDMKKLSCKAR